jgi:hypothetical protein
VSDLNATHAHSSFRALYTCRSQADIVILVRPIELAVATSATVLLELPVTVVERADLASLEPAGDAVEVESVLFCEVSIARSSGHTVQQELTLQIPHATVHSSLVVVAWLAWQSMHRSMMWLRQMAQLSTTMSQAQRATAFHWSDMLARDHTAMRFISQPAYLLHLELLLSVDGITACASFSALDFGCSACIGHLDVGHGCWLAVVCGVFVVVLCRERARCGVGEAGSVVVRRTTCAFCLSRSPRICVAPRD